MVSTQQCNRKEVLSVLVLETSDGAPVFIIVHLTGFDGALVFIIVHLTGFAQELSIVLGHSAAQHTVEDIVDQGASSTSSVETGDPSSREGATVSDKG